MEELKKQIEEKRQQVAKLNQEIRDLETQIIKDKWKGVPECGLDYYEIRDGKCPHGETIRGMVYCHHPMCDK